MLSIRIKKIILNQKTRAHFAAASVTEKVSLIPSTQVHHRDRRRPVPQQRRRRGQPVTVGSVAGRFKASPFLKIYSLRFLLEKIKAGFCTSVC
jgi:hypothetical protein